MPGENENPAENDEKSALNEGDLDGVVGGVRGVVTNPTGGKKTGGTTTTTTTTTTTAPPGCACGGPTR